MLFRVACHTRRHVVNGCTADHALLHRHYGAKTSPSPLPARCCCLSLPVAPYRPLSPPVAMLHVVVSFACCFMLLHCFAPAPPPPPPRLRHPPSIALRPPAACSFAEDVRLSALRWLLAMLCDELQFGHFAPSHPSFHDLFCNPFLYFLCSK